MASAAPGNLVIPSSAAQATSVSPQPPTVTPAQVAALMEQLMPKIAAFRAASQFESVPLNQFAPAAAAGASGSVPIANVGLGVRLVTEHIATFQITNSTTNTASVALSPAFPFNMVTSTSVGINGPPVTYDCPGYEGLLVALRTRKRGFSNASLGNQTVGMEDVIVRFSAKGSNITLNTAPVSTTTQLATNVVSQLSGVASISVAASAAAGTISQFTVTWYTFEKLAHSLDAMVGALPLQDSSIDATVTRTLVPAFSNAGNNLPFSNPPAALTISLISYVANTQYEYWTIPSNQPALYADIISSSYRVLTQRNRTFAASGQAALDVPMPKMEYLTAMHIVAWDSAGTYLTPLTHYSAFRLQYGGGSATPVAWKTGPYLARQYWDYGHSLADLAGYLLWDGAATADDINASDDSGWMDNVHAANPDFQVDIATALTNLPGTYNAVRESIVSGA